MDTEVSFALLRCPVCRGELALARDLFLCMGCGDTWPLRDGMPVLYREPWVTGNDRLLRRFYDGVPRLHDPAVRFLLPLLQGEGTESAMRAAYVDKLALDTLPAAGARLLEVSIGSGVNVDLVRARLAPGVAPEYWGLDLSTGMLDLCKKRLRKNRSANGVRLVQGDAHALPFPDATFDRVLHVGGIGGFADPGKALREMVRVAKPGAVVVVVDEQLDPTRKHNLLVRLGFKAITFYDAKPHAPVEWLPQGVTGVELTQAGRFYYCLRFEVPACGVR